MNTTYSEWLEWPTQDAGLRAELRQIAGDDAAIRDRFYCGLAFGTGGLRGILGAGTNRMNVWTVCQATRGLAEWLLQKNAAPGCAIAFDSRHMSREFAELAAAALAQRGVHVWMYAELTPTPMLSFAVRKLGCCAGIVITASHNPACYNGYKVYGQDGCQITPEDAAAIQRCIAAQPLLTDELPSYAAQRKAGGIECVSETVRQAYYDELLRLSVRPPRVPLHVVYSPLNGTGNRPVREMLGRLGNIRVNVVPEQELPDGNFPTCPFPNPELPEAMRLAAALAQKQKADLFFATDPDCDRVGVGVLTADGPRLFTGNEIGVLLLDYLCQCKTRTHTMPPKPVAVKTIVTTDMAQAVAAKYGVELRSVLTGFKYIGEQIGLLEQQGEEQRFIFGFEESCGYLSGTAVRDKDAVNAAMLTCEMAAWYKEQGRTLLDALSSASREYGWYKNELLTFTSAGEEGARRIQAFMARLREGNVRLCPPGEQQTNCDYLQGIGGLPKSDVIKVCLSGGGQVIVRPSGTEPKLKMYLSAHAVTERQAAEELRRLHTVCANAGKDVEN